MSKPINIEANREDIAWARKVLGADDELEPETWLDFLAEFERTLDELECARGDLERETRISIERRDDALYWKQRFVDLEALQCAEVAAQYADTIGTNHHPLYPERNFRD